MTWRNWSCGTCRPITTMQTVSGVASSTPTGPQSVIQKTAAAMIASGESPVLLPYSQGSSTLLLNSSSTMKSPIVSSGSVQPGDTANDRMIGNSDEITGPTYGMNRRTVASTPHRIGLGTPISHRPMRYRNAIGDVDDELHQQIAADAGAGLVHRLGRPVQVVGADQPDQPVTQILPFQQHEDHEHQHHARRADGADQRTQICLDLVPRGRARFVDFHRDRLENVHPPLLLGPLNGSRRRRRRRLIQFLAQILQHLRRLIDHAAAPAFGGAAHALDLGPDVLFVVRQVLRQIDKLAGDQRAEPQHHHEHQQHDQDHRRNPPQPPAPQPDDDRAPARS